MAAADDAVVLRNLLDYVESTAPTITAPVPASYPGTVVVSSRAVVPVTVPTRQETARKPPGRGLMLRRSQAVVSNPGRDTPHQVKVTARTIPDAQAKAKALYGTYRVVEGWRSVGFTGKRVTLLIEPIRTELARRPAPEQEIPALPVEQPIKPLPPTYAIVTHGIPQPRETARVEYVRWNRSDLRRIGAPPAVLRRLPAEDPASEREWELVLERLVIDTIGNAVPNSSLELRGHGPRGASALVEAAAAGLPLGELDTGGTVKLVTARAVIEAWRSMMPEVAPPEPTRPAVRDYVVRPGHGLFQPGPAHPAGLGPEGSDTAVPASSPELTPEVTPQTAVRRKGPTEKAPPVKAPAAKKPAAKAAAGKDAPGTLPAGPAVRSTPEPSIRAWIPETITVTRPSSPAKPPAGRRAGMSPIGAPRPQPESRPPASNTGRKDG